MASKTNNANTVPAGYHSVTPYLVVDGASRLIEFLKFTFEAELRDSFTDKEGKVQHAEVRVGDSVVMLKMPVR
jgi:PhnB protein